MPPRSRSTTSGTTDPGTDAPGGVSTQPAQQAAAENAPATERDEGTTVTLKLPFVTLSVTRPRGEPSGGAATSPRQTPGQQVTTSTDTSGGQRLLFYTGVAALGVAGLIEWPVAAAIAAGTYIAARTRSAPQQPAPRTPPGTRRGVPARAATAPAEDIITPGTDRPGTLP